MMFIYNPETADVSPDAPDPRGDFYKSFILLDQTMVATLQTV